MFTSKYWSNSHRVIIIGLNHRWNTSLRDNNNLITEKGYKWTIIIVSKNIQNIPLFQYEQNIIHILQHT